MLLSLIAAFSLTRPPSSLDIGYMAVSSRGPVIALNISSYTSEGGEEIWLLGKSSNGLRLLARKHFQTQFDTLVFSPDGRYLAAGETAGSDPSDIHLFKTLNLRPIRTLHGCEDMADISFSADSRYVFGSQYGAAFKWRTSDGRKVRTWKPFGTAEINGDMFESSSQQSAPGNVFKLIVGSFRGGMVVADKDFK